MTVEEQREAFEDARRQLIDAIDADLRKQEPPSQRKQVCQRFGGNATASNE